MSCLLLGPTAAKQHTLDTFSRVDRSSRWMTGPNLKLVRVTSFLSRQDMTAGPSEMSPVSCWILPAWLRTQSQAEIRSSFTHCGSPLPVWGRLPVASTLPQSADLSAARGPDLLATVAMPAVGPIWAPWMSRPRQLHVGFPLRQDSSTVDQTLISCATHRWARGGRPASTGIGRRWRR